MRPARALIDLAALRGNYRLARAQGGGAQVLAVIKADAYGHGAAACARALAEEGADGFAVACIEEALELREAGIQPPILLLEGFFEAAELLEIVRQRLWTVVHSRWQLEAIERTPLPAPLRVWLKLDSGMHRLGLPPAEYRTAYQRLRASGKTDHIVLMSHFARADETDSACSLEQQMLFERVCDGLAGPRSQRNSPSLLGWSGPASDWVRPGLLLYGLDPLSTPSPVSRRLRPVMTLESAIIALRELPPGESIGYGGTFTTARPSRIGVVALGYADGYPQYAPAGVPVQVAGRVVPLVGRVSMDMLMVDLSDHPDAGIGSRVELWGAAVPVTEVARRCRASNYQLVCGVKRVAKIYR